jgi:uncharacterized protein (UPF0332 family)
MSFDLKEYLVLAEEIIKLKQACKGEDNAYLRCSLSRAYYSVFCIARNMKGEWLRNYKPTEEEGYKSIHTKVLETYRDSEQQFDNDIYEHLRWLKTWRENADYRERTLITRKWAEDGIIRAKECLEILLYEYGDNY